MELEAAISSEGGLLLAKPTSDPPPEADSDPILEPQGRLSVDLEYHRVTIDDKPVTLTPREWAMLRVLVKNAGRVIGPRQLLQEAWGPDYSNEVDYIRAYIARLRKKLEPDPPIPATYSWNGVWATGWCCRTDITPSHGPTSRHSIGRRPGYQGE